MVGNEAPVPCHGPNARWWDADATLEEHAKALPLCYGCPIKYRCCDETREKFDKVTDRWKRRDMAGMYAGLMWGELCGPVSIWKWQGMQKGHPGREKPRPPDPVKPPPAVVECARPGCTETFVQDWPKNRKRFHSRSCGDAVRWAEKAPVERIAQRGGRK